jgi:hypothetical protein
MKPVPCVIGFGAIQTRSVRCCVSGFESKRKRTSPAGVAGRSPRRRAERLPWYVTHLAKQTRPYTSRVLLPRALSTPQEHNKKGRLVSWI